MITARLNKLLSAYREAKKLVGDSNRGQAITGVALRWCHRIRQAIKAEILVVEAVIRPYRLLQVRPAARRTAFQVKRTGETAS